MRRTLSPPTREFTAYHEAGHALVGFALLGNPGPVTIVRAGDALGRAHRVRVYSDPVAEVTEARAAGAAFPAHYLACLALKHIQHSIAGHAAEAAYAGHTFPLPLDEDLEHILALYAAWQGPGAPGLLRLFAVRTAHRERTRVRKWLERRRAHLDALARTLLERDTIDGETVGDVIDSAGDLDYRPAELWPRDLRAAMRRAKTT